MIWVASGNTWQWPRSRQIFNAIPSPSFSAVSKLRTIAQVIDQISSVQKKAHIVFPVRAQTSRPAGFAGFPRGRLGKAKSSKVASSIAGYFWPKGNDPHKMEEIRFIKQEL